jgi:hypothetical protein
MARKALGRGLDALIPNAETIIRRDATDGTENGGEERPASAEAEPEVVAEGDSLREPSVASETVGKSSVATVEADPGVDGRETDEARASTGGRRTRPMRPAMLATPATRTAAARMASDR